MPYYTDKVRICPVFFAAIFTDLIRKPRPFRGDFVMLYLKFYEIAGDIVSDN